MLPDGTRHEGRTDSDGWARVRGFRNDGEAKVCFPEFDELDLKTRASSVRSVVPVQGNASEDEGEPQSADESTPQEVESGEAPLPTLDLGQGDHFMEVTFVRANGKPLAGLAFSITTHDGKVFEASSDANGFAKIVGLASEAATVKLLKRAANA